MSLKVSQLPSADTLTGNEYVAVKGGIGDYRSTISQVSYTVFDLSQFNFGYGSTYSGASNAFAIGFYAKVTGSDYHGAIAIGYHAQVSGQNAIAIGKNSTAFNSGCIGIGNTVNAHGLLSIAIGNEVSAYQPYGISIGAQCKGYSFSNSAILIGYKLKSYGYNSILIGNYATQNDANNSICIGRKSKAINGDNVVIGAYAYNGRKAVAIGYKSGTTVDVNPYGATAIGAHSYTYGPISTAIGYKAGCAGGQAIAIGYKAVTMASPGLPAIAIGNNAQAQGTATAIGGNSTATASWSLVLNGNNVSSVFSNSFNATPLVQGSLVIGSKSINAADHYQKFSVYTPTSTTSFLTVDGQQTLTSINCPNVPLSSIGTFTGHVYALSTDGNFASWNLQPLLVFNNSNGIQIAGADEATFSLENNTTNAVSWTTPRIFVTDGQLAITVTNNWSNPISWFATLKLETS